MGDVPISVRGHTTLTDAFAAAAARNADRIAVDDGIERLTYRELDRRSNAIARQLGSVPMDDDQPVGILLERGVDLAIAMLGVLKVGRPYVPLDPRSPPARNALILEEAAPGAVVVPAAGRAALVPEGLPRVDVTATAGAAPPEPAVSPDERAYIIFTSGTTGRPKGVQVTHDNVLRLFSSTEPLFSYSCNDVWSVAHSFAFDFSVWELWGALLYGGCARILRRDEVADPQRFLTLLGDERVTVLSQTPSAFKQLLRLQPTPPDLPALRLVVFGGEALHFPDLTQWFDRFPAEQPRLVNMFGITETTVHASYHPVLPDDTRSAASIIGRPLPDLDLRLLDRQGRSVPSGEIGEIVVTGPGVAVGYLGQPDLTAERFVNVVTEHGTVVRGYRSGDLARLDGAGRLLYEGRADRQVKIRGHRIELGEIEAALTSHERVSHSVVVVRTDDAGLDRLVGYVVPSTGHPPVPESVLQHAAALLPAYMVPDAVGCLESLPTTVNGKLDLRALPPLARAGRGLDDTGVTDTQRTLCRTFEAVLGAVSVGLDDDFFDLGGHSFIATRLVNQVLADAVTGRARQLSVADLYRTRTVRALAAWLDAPEGTEPAAGDGTTFQLHDLQAGILLNHLLEPDSTAQHCVLAWHLEGPVDADALRAALAAVHRRHRALHSRYAYDDEAVGRPAPKSGPTWTEDIADSIDKAVHTLRDLLSQPFDLAEGRVWHAALVSVSDGSHLFGVAVHHVAFDGWSESVLARELSAVGTGPVPKPSQSTRRVSPESLALWQRTLAGTPPLRYPAPELVGPAGAPVAVEVPIRPELFAAATSVSLAGHRISAFTALLTAYATALTEEAGQFDVGVGTPIALRREAQDADVIGCLINVVCLRLRLDSDADDRTRLLTVERTVQEAFAHCGVGMGEIVRALNPPRDDRPPVFQTMFTFQSVPEAGLDLPGVTARRVHLTPTALPTELLAEVWPERSGRPAFTLSYAPDRVPAHFADAISKRFGPELERVVALGDAGADDATLATTRKV